MVNRCILAAFSAAPLLFAAAGALSADLSGQARSWSGCYVGANVGFAKADVDATDKPFTQGPFAGSGISWNSVGGPYETIGMNDKGLTGGIEGGCDYQIDVGGAAFVLGGVLDFSAMNLGGTGTSAIVSDTRSSFDVDWAASARIRAGLAASDALFYVTGGYALANINVRAFDTQTVPTAGLMDVRGGGTEGGWVAGAGVEWRLQENVSVGLEYLHYDFGKVTATGAATFPVEAFPRFENDVKIDMIRVGLKWRL